MFTHVAALRKKYKIQVWSERTSKLFPQGWDFINGIEIIIKNIYFNLAWSQVVVISIFTLEIRNLK